MFVFGSFRLDVKNASLRQGVQTILLTPKAFNVLRVLVEHAGQLVSQGFALANSLAGNLGDGCRAYDVYERDPQSLGR